MTYPPRVIGPGAKRRGVGWAMCLIQVIPLLLWTLPVRSPKMTNRCPYAAASQKTKNEIARRTPVTVPLWSMRIRIMASRHSAFYSPLLTCVSFLRDEGHEVAYSVLGPRQRSYALVRDGEVEIMQSAVSSKFAIMSCEVLCLGSLSTSDRWPCQMPSIPGSPAILRYEFFS